MRLLNQILNLSRIFDCFSRRFNKVVFNLKLSNLVDSDLHLKAVTSRIKWGTCENRRLSWIMITVRTSLVNLPIPENLLITWPYTDRPIVVRPHKRKTNVYFHTFYLLLEPRRKLIAHQCCDQLTAVKIGYPLTSITWPYRRLRCWPIEVKYFLKLSADKLLVFSNDCRLKSIFF